MSFYFEIVANWTNHEKLPSISSDNYLGLIKPSMSCEISRLGQLFDLFIGFEGIVFNLEQFEDISSCTADQMGLSGANSNRLSSLNTEIADSQSSTSTNIQKHQLIFWFSCHTTGIFGLRG